MRSSDEANADPGADMMAEHSAKAGLLAAVAAVLILGLGAGSPARAFTQSVGGPAGNLFPMGHERLTRMAAIEVLGHTPVSPPDVPDPADPRIGWRPGNGGAWNIDLSSPGAQGEARRIKAQAWDDRRYAARYKAIYDVIVGERWVDLAGYN